MANTRLRLPPLTRAGARRPSIAARWWVYQRERFPIATHAPLIAAFSFCTLSFSAMARGHIQVPAGKAILVAFATAFIFFLQLRIADEFKDFEDDARYRPYRPVPRGLISLRELGVAAAVGAGVQLLLALWLSPALLPFLLGVWVYLGVMSREFFVSRWLKAHPATYMWSHMLILPLVDLYGTACDWRVAGAAPPIGLAFLLTVSFCNGFVVEIGRKIRAPADEEVGVETYSALWGRPRAVAIWCTALVVTAVFALLAALQIQFAVPAAVLLALLLGAAAVIAVRFLRATTSRRAKLIELISGVWTLLMYLSLGAVPLILTLHGGSSPMGSQASSLMSCLFQGCCLAPEGGAPADRTLTPWLGECDLYSNPARSGAHLVHDALLLLPVGTTYHGTPKQYSSGKVQMSSQIFSHKQAEAEGQWNFRLKPPEARLTAWAQALRLAAG